MKKLFASIIIAIILVSSLSAIPTVMASGDSFYYIKEATTMIIDDSSKGLSGSINLPATWYVKMTTTADETTSNIRYKIVEYNGIRGKVDSSKLSAKSMTLTTTPHFWSDIVYNNSKLRTLTTYSDSAVNTSIPALSVPNASPIRILALTSSEDYLLSYSNGSTTSIAFARYEDIGGNKIIPTENLNKIDPDSPGNNGDLTPPTNDGLKEPANNLVRIVLIIAICLLAVIIVFLIFKPAHKKSGKDNKNDDYYSDYNKH